MMKVLISIVAVALISSAAMANFVSGDFTNASAGVITNQSTWTAGTDATGAWYGGSGWVIAGTPGSEYADQENMGYEGQDGGDGRILLQALPITAGTYTWTVTMRNSDNNNFCGLQVLYAKSGAVVPMAGPNFIYNEPLAKPLR